MKAALNSNIRKSRRWTIVVTLATLLTVITLGLAARAQEGGESPKTSVFVDKDRDAVLQVENTHKSTVPGATMNGGIDVPAGLSALTLSLDLPAESANNLKGTNVSAYWQMDTNAAILLANLKVPLPPNAQQMKVSADVKAQNADTMGHADAKLNLQIANTPPDMTPFSKLAIDGTVKTDYKIVSSTLNVAVNAPTVQQVPLRALTITVAEPDSNNTVLDMSATIDLTSQAGQGMKAPLEQIKQDPKKFEAMIKDKLVALNIAVDSVTISKADVSGNDGTLSLSIKASGLRAKLSDAIQMMLPLMAHGANLDTNALKQALDNLLALSFNKLSVTMTVQNDALTANVTVDAKNVDKFLPGYMSLMSTFQESSLKQMQEKTDNPGAVAALRWWHLVQLHTNDLSLAGFGAMASAGCNTTSDFKLNVETKPQLTVDGSFTFDMTNFDKYVAALKSKGMPVIDNSGLVLHLKTDGGQLTGSLYGSARGNLPEVLKSIFVDPAKQDPDLKKTADTLSAIKWQDGRMQFQLTENKVRLTAYTKTSDLTAAVNDVLSIAVPALAGTQLQGFRVQVETRNGDTATTARIGFKSFMTGKSPDEIKETVSGLTKTDVTVNDAADTAQATLAKLDTPAVEMPGALASVKSDAEAALAAAPATTPTAAANGGMNMGVLIGIGVAVLALLGIVMASTGRKPA